MSGHSKNGLKKGIAGTLRFVEKLVNTMSRFGHELGKHHDTQVDWVVATLSGGTAKTPNTRLTGKLQAGTEIGPAAQASRARDVGSGQNSRTGIDYPRVAELLRQNPECDGPSGGGVVC